MKSSRKGWHRVAKEIIPNTHPLTRKIRTLQVYDFILMCVMLLEEALLNNYKQAQ
jgi:hypothetical protein